MLKRLDGSIGRIVSSPLKASMANHYALFYSDDTTIVITRSSNNHFLRIVTSMISDASSPLFLFIIPVADIWSWSSDLFMFLNWSFHYSYSRRWSLLHYIPNAAPSSSAAWETPPIVSTHQRHPLVLLLLRHVGWIGRIILSLRHVGWIGRTIVSPLKATMVNRHALFYSDGTTIGIPGTDINTQSSNDHFLNIISVISDAHHIHHHRGFLFVDIELWSRDY